MNKAEILYQKIKKNEPFCFIKMNDGECGALVNHNASLSRGFDKSSERMSQKLKEVFEFEHKDYYIGIPCKKCWGKHYKNILPYIEKKNKNNLLLANILINTNINKTIQILESHLKDKHIVLICNTKMKNNIKNLEKINIKVNQILTVSEKYAFENDYDTIKNEVNHIPDQSVVICCCGPLGRILCHEWFKKNQSLTCLELGSFFDPLLNNKTYLYQTGTLQFCNECNPSNSHEDCHLLKHAQNKLHKECYYFNDVQSGVNFYQNEKKALKNFENRLYNEPNNEHIIKLIKQLKTKIYLKEFKKRSISDLYKTIKKYYNTNQEFECLLASDLYIEYFKEIDPKNIVEVQFINACVYINENKEKAIEKFEYLYNIDDLNKEYEEKIKNQLMKLYDKKDESIPKVIHLIYFKKRPLQHYHYGCIMHMVEHLKNYQIRIYNDIEPEDNIYWKQLKKIEKIEIIHYKRPTEFDGFNLQHIQYCADVARLNILYEHGGVYLDLDMLIFKDFSKFISGKDLYISYEGKSNGPLINSFLAVKPKNEFIKIWLNSFKTGLRMEKWAYHIGQSNKQLIERNKHYIIKYGIECIDSKYFFGFPWTETHKFRNIEEHKKDEMYGIHLFDTILHDTLKKNNYFEHYIIHEENKYNFEMTNKSNNHTYLVYSCVFFNEKYINLLGLLLRSYSLYQHQSIKYLIFTNSEFEPKVRKLCESLFLNYDIWVLDLKTIFESAYCRLMIFDYPHIDLYKKILYLDCDVLIGNNIQPMFDLIKEDKLYALKENNSKDPNHGSIFFPEDYPCTSTFSSGVMLFNHSLKMKTLFKDILNHIYEYKKTHSKGPGCLDQPFIIYHALINKLDDNETLIGHVMNNPKEIKDEIIYHFPSLVGIYETKIHYMNDFLRKIMNDFKRKEIIPPIQIIRENKNIEKNINIYNDIWTCSDEMRHDIKEFFKDKTNYKIAEIGSHKGYTTRYFSKIFKKVYAVDINTNWTKHNKELNKDRNNIEYIHLNIYDEKWNKLPEDIDIVFIDADHSYNHCKMDIENSIIKFKQLKYIICNDYGAWKGVKKIVNEKLIDKSLIFEKYIGLSDIPFLNNQVVKNSAEGIICSVNKLINDRYIYKWENSNIDYLKNGLMNAWGKGNYYFIYKKLIEANFGGESHVIHFHDNYEKYTSIRKRDFQIINGERIKNNSIKVEHFLTKKQFTVKLNDIQNANDFIRRISNHERKTNTKLIELLNNIPERYNIIDSGAHVGDTGIFLSKELKDNNKENKIIMIEPDINKINFIKNTVKINKLENYVEIYNYGLDNKESYKALNKTTHSGGWFIKNGNDFKVKPLDDIIDIHKPIYLIKLDVEGYELNALKGAKNIINKYKPLLLIEEVEYQLNRYNCNINKLHEYLNKINYYKILKLDGDCLYKHVEKNVKKVALCFFGLTRSLKYTINSIQKNILDVLKDNDIEYTIYLHTYDLEKLDLKRSQENNCKLDIHEYKLLKPDYIQITHQEDFDKSFDWDYVKKFGNPWKDQENNYDNLYNLFRQLNSIQICTQLWKNHNEYDCYLYLRPDLNYEDKLNINELNLVYENKNSIITPDWMKNSGLNDRFAFGSKESILKWANRIDDRIEYQKKFHSEKYLNWVMKKYHIKNYFTKMKACRIRANGINHDKKNFNK